MENLDNATQAAPHVVGMYTEETIIAHWSAHGLVWSDEWAPGQPRRTEKTLDNGDTLIRWVHPMEEKEARETCCEWSRF